MWRVLLLLLFFSVVPAAADEVCLPAPYLPADAGDPDTLRLAELSARLGTALTGFPALRESFANGRAEICLAARLDGALGYFTPDPPRIVLRRDLPDALALGILLHEARHLDQAQRGACIPDGLTMSDHAAAAAAMEADASAVSLLLAWELRERGAPQIWDALAGWPQQADIAAAMRDTFEAGGTVADAAARGFAAWFEREDRVFGYYRASCTAYLEEQERSHALDAKGRLGPAYLGRLCQLPDGARYGCTLPETPR